MAENIYFPLSGAGGGGSGVEVIERAFDLSTGNFTTALTADEFDKLKKNEATLLLTGSLYDIIPFSYSLNNPVVADGSGLGSDTNLFYVMTAPLEVNEIIIANISSSNLSKIDMIRRIQDSTPIVNRNEPNYNNISDNPLFGFISNEADVSVLNVPKSFKIGSFTYNKDSWTYSSSVDLVGNYADNVREHIYQILNDTNCTTYEAVLELNTTSDYTNKRRYSAVIHVGSSLKSSYSSTGIFTIHEGAGSKVKYVQLKVVANSSGFEVTNFKVFEDDKDITATFLSTQQSVNIQLYIL